MNAKRKSGRECGTEGSAWGKAQKLMQVPGSSRVRSLISHRKTEATGIGKEEDSGVQLPSTSCRMAGLEETWKSKGRVVRVKHLQTTNPPNS